MKKIKKLFQIGILLCSFVITAPAGVYAESAKLWITKDFANQTILEQEVSFHNASVMDILKKNAQVENAYGGGFVVSINGIGEEGQRDWFYYVNGLLSPVGAAAYFPKDGDVIWWDHHRWSDAVYVSAVIGSYPHPFLGGYDWRIPKTVIFATENMQQAAEALQAGLHQQGIAEVTIKKYVGTIEQKDVCRIFLGRWKDIQQDTTVQKVVKNFQKSGFFVKFDETQITALDITGRPGQSFKEGACILAIASGFPKEPPLWIMTGTDESQVEKAAMLLKDNSERIQFHSGALLTDEKIINLPIAKLE